MNIIKIPGCLQPCPPQSTKTPKRILIPALLDVPPRTLWARINPQYQRHGGYTRAPQLQAPRYSADLIQSEVGGKPHQDAESYPELPTHDQRAADSCGGILGGEDRDRGGFCAHADAQQGAAEKKLYPGACEGAADHGGETEERRDEDSAPTAEVVV